MCGAGLLRRLDRHAAGRRLRCLPRRLLPTRARRAWFWCRRPVPWQNRCRVHIVFDIFAGSPIRGQAGYGNLGRSTMAWPYKVLVTRRRSFPSSHSIISPATWQHSPPSWADPKTSGGRGAGSCAVAFLADEWLRVSVPLGYTQGRWPHGSFGFVSLPVGSRRKDQD